jgi:succinate-acetate transporter protein
MTFYLTIATFKTNWALVILFVLLFIVFLLLDFGLNKAGGDLGLVVAAIAWYIAAAGVINFTFKKVVLPVGPIS